MPECFGLEDGYLNTNFDRTKWLRCDSETGVLFRYNPETGGYDIAISVAEHTHSELGDINFTGTISTAGQQGITGSRTIGGYTITFKNGLLVGFTGS